jgi:hypothetical protein
MVGVGFKIYFEECLIHVKHLADKSQGVWVMHIKHLNGVSIKQFSVKVERNSALKKVHILIVITLYSGVEKSRNGLIYF